MKWEYKIVYINAKKWTNSGLPEDINEQFDNYGYDGWELVKIESKLNSGFLLGWGSQTVGYIAFFKREIR